MELLIKAGLLWPVSAPPVQGGWVAVENGTIAAVGVPEDEPDCRETIDLSGKLVMPGFVNVHSHLQFAAARGKIAARTPFIDWVREAVSVSANLSEGEMAGAAADGAREMIASGVTAVGDIVNNLEAARAVAESGLCAVIFAEALAPHPKDAGRSFDALVSMLAGIEALGTRAGISPHAPHTVSPELFGRIMAFAAERRLPVMCHVAESADEEEFMKNGGGGFSRFLAERGSLPEGFRGYGASPTAYLHKNGFLKKLLAVHLNCVDADDAALLEEDSAVPVFCPSSSRWFGREEVMPFDLFLSRGMRPCLGTDSLASANRLSMLDELRAARGYFPKIPLPRFIEAATLNGALALGIPAGALAPGLRADIVAFSLDGREAVEAVFGAERASFVMAGGRKIA